MSGLALEVNPVVALSSAHSALDELRSVDVTALPDEAMLDYWRELERLRRRLPSVEHPLVLEAEARGLPETVQVRSVAQLLRWLLRVDPSEASGRVRAAEAAGARRALTGQPVSPVCPAVATAQADGAISERHARVIV